MKIVENVSILTAWPSSAAGFFWSDWDSAKSCDKFTGSDMEVIVQGEVYYGERYFHFAILLDYHYSSLFFIAY